MEKINFSPIQINANNVVINAVVPFNIASMFESAPNDAYENKKNGKALLTPREPKYQENEI